MNPIQPLIRSTDPAIGGGAVEAAWDLQPRELLRRAVDLVVLDNSGWRAPLGYFRR